MPRLDIAKLRLQCQHLGAQRLDHIVDVVQSLCAVQAQDYPGAKWALALRTTAATDGQVDELFNSGAFLRTHVLRPTWHFVTPADVRWLLELTGPRINSTMASYNLKLELTGKVFARTNQALAAALEGGKYLTRAELGEVLARARIRASGQRLAHILMRAETEAVVCSGPLRGRQFTYALLAERAPHSKTLPRDEALGTLALRYFASHGPATLADFSWWSGLLAADTRAAVELVRSQLQPEVVAGRTYWFTPSHAERLPRPLAHLLPNYDEYLIAFKDRSASFRAGVQDLIGDWRDLLFTNPVAIDGLVVGSWQRVVQKRETHVAVKLLAAITRTQQAALQRAVAQYSVFLGQPVKLVYVSRAVAS